MNLYKQPRLNLELPVHAIEVIEPHPENCPIITAPPEGNVKRRNYRMLNENLCTYSPTGDINTSPGKGKLVPKYEVCSALSPPRQKILDLLRPEDPGRDALEAIVRPSPRRGLTRPFDEDTRRFLQRALLSPSPQVSSPGTPEHQILQDSKESSTPSSNSETPSSKSERSLADELKEAEEDEKTGGIRRELLREFRKRGGGIKEAMERERMGKLALSVEEDEDEDNGLTTAARRLDALLAESRSLHEELAGIQEDIQAECARAGRCAAAARALTAESRALRYLDDVVALLKGDVKAAARGEGLALRPRTAGARKELHNMILRRRYQGVRDLNVFGTRPFNALHSNTSAINVL